MRGSLECDGQLFNVETDAEHIRAWVVDESGQRLAGAVFEIDRASSRRVVIGTWSAGNAVALAALSCGDAAVFLNESNWLPGLWHVEVQADTPQRTLRAGEAEATMRLHPPGLAAAAGEEEPTAWGRAS